jgi:hypothetical protein
MIRVAARTLRDTRHRSLRLVVIAMSGALSAPAFAQQFSHEREIGELRLGQRVMVDDGSCPAGQILEISGATLTPEGVTRVRKCIARKGTKKQ